MIRHPAFHRLIKPISLHSREARIIQLQHFFGKGVVKSYTMSSSQKSNVKVVFGAMTIGKPGKPP